jgi:hypothetical protein
MLSHIKSWFGEVASPDRDPVRFIDRLRDVLPRISNVTPELASALKAQPLIGSVVGSVIVRSLETKAGYRESLDVLDHNGLLIPLMLSGLAVSKRARVPFEVSVVANSIATINRDFAVLPQTTPNVHVLMQDIVRAHGKDRDAATLPVQNKMLRYIEREEMLVLQLLRSHLEDGVRQWRNSNSKVVGIEPSNS